MKIFKLLAVFIILITMGCAVNNGESDSETQIKKARAALKAKEKAEMRMNEAQNSYQSAMAAFDETLSEGEHERGLKYLFIDHEHIQSMEGVEQVFHNPVKEKGPVITPEYPWEDDRVDIWSMPVWSEEMSRWRMWYWGGDGLYSMYAESTDGINWHKPMLGLVEWNGSKENNIINLGFDATGKENRIVVLRDDHEQNPEKRFKGITRVHGHIIGLESRDGLNWKPMDNSVKIASGDEYRFGYDALQHRFIVTSKTPGSSPVHYTHTQGDRPLSEFGRRVSLSVSEDFKKWTDPVLVMWGDEKDQELGKQRIKEIIGDPERRHPIFIAPEEFYTDIYNMALFTYEDIYLGLPMIFNQSGIYAPRWGGNQDGVLYPSLVSSRDLYEWNRLNREPFIPLSKLTDKENYDYGMISAMPPVLHNDMLWFYYNGSRYTHLTNEIKENLINTPNESKHAIFLARLRVDGFASLHAGKEQGSILTVPVKVTGPNLYVNVDAEKGELLTEIRDKESGMAIISETGDGDYSLNAALPVNEDASSIKIQWNNKKDISELLGREVVLNFSLTNGHLYSFWFDD